MLTAPQIHALRNPVRFGGRVRGQLAKAGLSVSKGGPMPIPTMEELLRWFDELDANQRICRVWVKTEAHAHICGREAVGLDRLGGSRALVCEGHKPREEWFVRLKAA